MPLEDQDKPYDWHDRLVQRSADNSSTEARQYDFLSVQRGLTLDTLERFKVGWDGERITLPVRVQGKWINVRRYLPNAKPNQDKILPLKGHGGAVLYPSEVLRGNTLPVLFCEGEMDALLAMQEANGQYVAITGTGGASVIPKDLSPLTGRDVFIAYDADMAGRKGATKLAAALASVAHAVHVLDVTRLGLPPDSKEDLTDFFVHRKGCAAALVEQMDLLRAGRPERFRLVFATELALPVPPMRWLVDGVWPEDSYGVLGGEKKTLKTYNALALALAVCSGEPYLGSFCVPAVGRVLYFLGEGGQKPTQRRLQRVAVAMGIDLRDIGSDMAMFYDVAPANAPEFVDAVKRGLDTVQPNLVVLDPLYAFHPPGVEAQNLYDRGQMLSELRELIGEQTAFIVADHFRKTGKTDLDLDSIAQSGMAQWSDSWILQKHRESPRVDEGQFRLAVEFGSRQWGGSRYSVDWSLGSFDAKSGEHEGAMSWAVERLDWQTASQSSGGEARHEERIRAILQLLTDEPDQHTKSRVLERIGGNRDATRKAFDGMVGDHSIVSKRLLLADCNGQKRPQEVWALNPPSAKKIRMSALGDGSSRVDTLPEDR